MFSSHSNAVLSLLETLMLKSLHSGAMPRKTSPLGGVDSPAIIDAMLVPWPTLSVGIRTERPSSRPGTSLLPSFMNCRERARASKNSQCDSAFGSFKFW